MSQTTEHFTVNRAGIGEMSARIKQFLTRQGLERRETERMCLTAETLLRRVSEELGWGTPCVLTLRRRMGRARIQMSYPGAAFDPTLIGRESEGDIWSAQLLANAGLVPLWSYRRGVNRLVLEPPARERSVWLAQGAAIALAVLLGVALPGAWTEAADRLLLTPLLDCLFAALAAFAGPAFFFSAVSIVCGTGDTLTLGEMGKTVLGRFYARTCLWALTGTAAMAALCFPAVPGAAQPAAPLRRLIPGDPLSPFLNGVPGQILFLALLAGVLLLMLDGRAGRVREWAEQCNILCAAIVERLCRLSPLLTFAALLRQLWRGSLASLAGLWKPLAAFAAGGLVTVAVKLLLTAARQKESVPELASCLWPTVRAAFSTASSVSAFGRTMDNCENELGVAHGLVLVGLPIGNLICVPVTALCFPAALLYLAQRGGVTLDIGALILLALLSAALAMALPPARGALLAGFGLLLTQFGLPAEGLAVMAALNVVFDPVATALSNAYLQLELMGCNRSPRPRGG